MIRKDYSKDGKTCKVTFSLEGGVEDKSACICGDFNNWEMDSTPMKKNKDGALSATVKLKAGQEYKFRYCVDNSLWENDPDADGSIPNPYGSEDSIIRI